MKLAEVIYYPHCNWGNWPLKRFTHTCASLQRYLCLYQHYAIVGFLKCFKYEQKFRRCEQLFAKMITTISPSSYICLCHCVCAALWLWCGIYFSTLEFEFGHVNCFGQQNIGKFCFTDAEAWKVHQSSYSLFLYWNLETTPYSKCSSSPAGDIPVNSLSTASDLNEAIWNSPALINF